MAIQQSTVPNSGSAIAANVTKLTPKRLTKRPGNALSTKQRKSPAAARPAPPRDHERVLADSLRLLYGAQTVLASSEELFLDELDGKSGWVDDDARAAIFSISGALALAERAAELLETYAPATAEDKPEIWMSAYSLTFSAESIVDLIHGVLGCHDGVPNCRQTTVAALLFAKETLERAGDIINGV